MTTTNDHGSQTVVQVPIKKAMLAGAITGLLLISFFLLMAGEADPTWNRFWRLRPLFVVPAAGAMGAAFFAWLSSLQSANEWLKFSFLMVGIIGFVVSIWLGSVLGLAGTYWH